MSRRLTKDIREATRFAGDPNKFGSALTASARCRKWLAVIDGPLCRLRLPLATGRGHKVRHLLSIRTTFGEAIICLRRAARDHLSSGRRRDRDDGMPHPALDLEPPGPVPAAEPRRADADDDEGEHRHHIGDELEELRRGAGDLG